MMPRGIPVACVAVNGAANAGILAAEMLALGDDELAAKLDAMRKEMRAAVNAKDKKLQSEIGKLLSE